MNERGVPVRPAQQADVDDDIVMFLLGPDGEFLEPATPQRGRTLAEVVEAFRRSLEVDHSQDPFGRRHVGQRPVHGTGRPVKPGYRDEIVVTLRASPTAAAAEAVSGRFLASAGHQLRVDRTTLTSRRYEMTWRGTIRIAPWRLARDVRVRLFASPSLNVTAMALSPEKPRRVARRSFLRVGSQVMDELSRRLDDLVEQAGDAYDPVAATTERTGP